MFAIYKKELRSYFSSPVAYALIGLFVLLSSIFFILINLQQSYADFSGNLSTMSFLLLFIIPILTMRVLAEEKKNGTEVFLVTSPASITDIVVGKYLAAFTVFLVMVVITFIYPIILFSFGKPPFAQLMGAYIGFILLGAAFIAVGVFASSLTESQVVAAIIGVVSLLVMWLMDNIAGFVGGFIAKILNWFSLLSRYDEFNRGILNLSPIIYYLSFIAVFIFLTIQVIERRRWSEG
jgi:ABC-2 type transporter.